MKLKQTIALVALVTGGLLAGGTLSAQETAKETPKDGMKQKPDGKPGGPGAMRPPMTTDKIIAELGLSDEQKPKFKAAIEDRQKKLAALRTDTSVAPEDKKKKSKEIRDAANVEIKKILTPEQHEKYLKLATGPRNRPGFGEKPGDKPADKAAKKAAAKE